MFDGPYSAFIIAAYSTAIVVVTALIAWVALDRRSLARRMADLEARGVRRRSQSREAKP